jgi:hypothetical protein
MDTGLTSANFPELGQPYSESTWADLSHENADEAAAKEYQSICDEAYAPLKNLLTDLGPRAVAMARVSEYDKPLHRRRGFGREYPAAIGGFLVPRAFIYGSSAPKLQVAARRGGAATYLVSPLYFDGRWPTAKIALGDRV